MLDELEVGSKNSEVIPMTFQAAGLTGNQEDGFDEFETYFRCGRGNWGHIGIFGGTDYVEDWA